MQSELDRKFDETLAEIIAPGGRLVIERDEIGRAYVANFPGTLPLFFKTFCALNGAVEAVERIDRESDSGDVLVFLPSERDIREVSDLLEGRRLRHVDACVT